MIGRTISHYQVVEKLGEGGMGVVYRAVDTRLNRAVAIKVLPREATADAEHHRRFVQEARAASALNHPNIGTVYDIDVDSGVWFIAMEYVAGRTLDRAIGRKGLSVGAALTYAIQIADALAAAHVAGIVHRDLKPANVMITDAGRVKVLDFGVSKLVERADAAGLGATAAVTADVAPRTEEGTIIATVAYMSPEQAEGKKVDARSDIFSFGSLFYEMLTGRRAFQGETKVSTLSAILVTEPPPASAITDGVPRELDRIIAHCLRKDPARRFQHLDDVKTLLEQLKEEWERLPATPGADTGHATSAGSAEKTSYTRLPDIPCGFADRNDGRRDVRSRARSVRAVTFDPRMENGPIWSPNGRQIVFAADPDGPPHLFQNTINQTDRDEVLVPVSGWVQFPYDWTPDGRFIIYGDVVPKREKT